MYHWQYKQGGYLRETELNSAHQTALLFMGFTNHVNGQKNFSINDKLLLQENNQPASSIQINSFNQSREARTMGTVTISICYSVWVRDAAQARMASVPVRGHFEDHCENYFVWPDGGGGGSGSNGDGSGGGGNSSGGDTGSGWADEPCLPSADPHLPKPALPPAPCNAEPAWEPTEEPLIKYNLSASLNLNNAQSLWLVNNPEYINSIYEELQSADFSEEAKTIAKIIIDQGTNNFLDESWNESFGNIAYPHVQSFYEQCCPGLLTPLNPSTWGIKWANETRADYAYNRLMHKDWSKVKCLWEATQESFHTALDVAGMVPVIGEVFDLTSGILYTIQGDGDQAFLSFASMLPIAGWAANGVKYVRRLDNLKYFTSTVAGKTMVTFGGYNSSKFRKALGIAGDATKQAHHVLPRADVIVNHEVVQKATQVATNQGFHIDNVLNGIPVETWRNQPNHPAYTDKIYRKLERFLDEQPNAAPTECYNKLLSIINEIKQVIINNPTVKINDLIF